MLTVLQRSYVTYISGSRITTTGKHLNEYNRNCFKYKGEQDIIIHILDSVAVEHWENHDIHNEEN